jgi:hypothetical protein
MSGNAQPIRYALASALLVSVVGTLSPVSAGAQPTGVCGEIANLTGPFDYRSIDPQMKRTVETYHFTTSVESLTSGRSGALGADLDYTLRAIPNHPRALLAMMRYGEKLKSEKVPGANWSVACYFDRAIRFQPADPTVRTLYGTYLARRGQRAAALEQLEEAQRLGGDDANLQYNLGLVYFDLKKYDEALAFAQKAYAQGFPLPGLRNKLQQVGKWAPPGDSAAAAAAQKRSAGAPK